MIKYTCFSVPKSKPTISDEGTKCEHTINKQTTTTTTTTYRQHICLMIKAYNLEIRYNSIDRNYYKSITYG